MPVVEKSVTNQTLWELCRGCCATVASAAMSRDGLSCWEGFAAVSRGEALVLLISCHLVTLAFGGHRTFIPPVSQCPLHSACLLKYLDHSSLKYLCAEFLKPTSQYVAAHAGGTTVGATLKLFSVSNSLLEKWVSQLCNTLISSDSRVK